MRPSRAAYPDSEWPARRLAHSRGSYGNLSGRAFGLAARQRCDADASPSPEL